MASKIAEFAKKKQSLHGDIDHVLLNEEQIHTRIKELGAAVSKEYAGKDLLLVSVLKGSIVFMADLVRAIEVPHEIDFMATSSYGAGVTSSGAAHAQLSAAHSSGAPTRQPARDDAARQARTPRD